MDLVSKQTKGSNRTRIAVDWRPSSDGLAYASERGIDDEEIEAFRDYHLAYGTLMANWDAAWRTWCRNAMKFNRTRAPSPPLLQAIDAADTWGISSWASQLPGVERDTFGGEPILALNGYDVQAVARDVCEAAGWPPDHRGELTPLADWIRVGITPDVILEAIRTSKKPDRPNLRYYHRRVMEWGQRVA